MNRLSWTPVVSAWALSAALLTPIAGASPAAIPSTADYRNATQPMITGTVSSMSQHELRVATEQGSDATLILDSRSIVPADLRRGMMVRVEFHYVTDRTGHVGRVIPIRSGDKTTRELAYSLERDREDAAEVRFADYTPDENRNDRDQDGWKDDDAKDNDREDADQDGWQDVKDIEARPLDSTIPGTYAYEVATRPMIAGQVTRVTDQQIVVDTRDGGDVILLMDSHTLVPSTLQSGMGVRIDYVTLDNGDYLAKRVTEDRTLGGDRNDGTYRSTTNDNVGSVTEGDESAAAERDADRVEAEATTAEADRDENRDTEQDRNAATGTNNDADHDGRADDAEDNRLPGTASGEPLMVLFGAAALGAGALALRKR